jgi:hypothetical protein
MSHLSISAARADALFASAWQPSADAGKTRWSPAPCTFRAA